MSKIFSIFTFKCLPKQSRASEFLLSSALISTQSRDNLAKVSVLFTPRLVTHRVFFKPQSALGLLIWIRSLLSSKMIVGKPFPKRAWELSNT
ncbi:hypothetical protein ACTXT7_017097 [Hymenolepis weldensis]